MSGWKAWTASEWSSQHVDYLDTSVKTAKAQVENLTGNLTTPTTARKAVKWKKILDKLEKEVDAENKRLDKLARVVERRAEAKERRAEAKEIMDGY